MKATPSILHTTIACAGAALLALAPLALADDRGRDRDDRGSQNSRDNRGGRVFATNNQNQLLLLAVEAGGASNYSDDRDNRNGRPRDVAVLSRRPITGLAAGDRLVGIDFRPATGVLYGLGSPNGGAGLAQLYTIDTRTAVATPVGARALLLEGTSFGFDFNPAVDRIRVVGNTGLNARLVPDTGAVAAIDTRLQYPAAGDPNAGRAPGVVAAAYTNPDVDPLTNTVLYDIDAAREADAGGGGDVLTIQVPPNAGTLNTVGRLRLDVDQIAGFDIGPTNTALAVVRVAGQPASRLVSISLASGVATDQGRIIGANGEVVTGLAIELGPQFTGR